MILTRKVAFSLVVFLTSVIQTDAMSWMKYQPQNVVMEGNRITIDKDYDLRGNTLDVPANVTIVFAGGSIRNGILKGNGTKLENLQSDCLLCSFDGSFEDLEASASWFGIHPKGDGTVKGTPNQQESFYRVNTLLKCVRHLKLSFEKGIYGFGGGGDIPQGKGQSARLWYGHYAFYVYDYEKSYPLTDFEIDGNDAIFLNVYPYYVGSWTRDAKGKMTVFKSWDPDASSAEKGKHATEAGGFLYIRTEDPINVCLHHLTVDMNRDLFQYGGYQAWTQNQCGIALTTNGNITLDHLCIKNNVTDGVLILCQNPRTGSKNEVYPKSIKVSNSSFENNVRLGLSLSVGQQNIVDNCDFISNGRISLINDSYKFESPFSDIDIEPIIDRPFADVLIQNCRFKETNRQSIVSSRQNIKSIIVRNCSAENTLPRIEYSTVKDSKGQERLAVVPSQDVPVFINAHAVESLALENIDLTDVALGSGFICYEPTAGDVGKEGEYYVTKPVTKRAAVKNLTIHSGSTYTRAFLAERANAKDRIVNLLNLSSSKYNYQYTSGSWKLVVPAKTKYGYGGWDLENVVYDVKDGYGIRGAASWDAGVTQVKDLTINLIERRTEMPVFNFMFSDGTNGGISKESGVSIERLTVKDRFDSFNKSPQEPSFKGSVKQLSIVKEGRK